MLKMPRLRTIREFDPASSDLGFELTERALSTLPADEARSSYAKARYSVMNDDDDGATFDAEFSDFGDKYGMWRNDHLLIQN